MAANLGCPGDCGSTLVDARIELRRARVDRLSVSVARIDLPQRQAALAHDDQQQRHTREEIRLVALLLHQGLSLRAIDVQPAVEHLPAHQLTIGNQFARAEPPLPVIKALRPKLAICGPTSWLAPLEAPQ